jgi:hypothetical protein
MYTTSEEPSDSSSITTGSLTNSVPSESESGTSRTISGSSTSLPNSTTGTQTGISDPPNAATPSEPDSSDTPIGGGGNTSETAGSKRLSTGAMVGIVTGGVILLLFTLLLGLWRYRRRQQRNERTYQGAVTSIPHEAMGTRKRRLKREKNSVSSSAAELVPGRLNEGIPESYPMTSYPLHPRKRIARERGQLEDGGGGGPSLQNEFHGNNVPNNDYLQPFTPEVNQQDAARSRDDPQVPWLRRDSPSSENLPVTIMSPQLVAPIPVALSTARREGKRQRQLAGGGASGNAQAGMSRDGRDDTNGIPPERAGYDIRPPSSPDRRTISSDRPTTAPPPYMPSSPPRGRRGMEANDESQHVEHYRR